MAAYRYGTKIATTQRYDLGEFLRERTDRSLFLTATPHKGNPENFARLLQLLDPDVYAKGGEITRYIEVKGGAVALTPNEWIKAQRFGKDYWLYIVVNCESNPELFMIQDPASKLKPTEEISVVRYMVAQEDWQQAARFG